MPLKLFYITNRPEIAVIADASGVDRIFIDMEYIGKQDRQGGMDTVQNHHTIDDIRHIRSVVTKSEVLVRVNPIHEKTSEYTSSDEEIRQAIGAGADIIMLPMYRSLEEVERFLSIVNGNAKTMLLCETTEAANIMSEVVAMPEVDEIHIGLNDLHLARKKKFMFELLADGTVESLANIIRPSDKTFGFGGIARIGYGTLPAEKIIAEHYRLGSRMAILSRSFCNADKITDIAEIQRTFSSEVQKIREVEDVITTFSELDFKKNQSEVVALTKQIVSELI